MREPMLIPESVIRSALITADAYGSTKITKPCESDAMQLARVDAHVFGVLRGDIPHGRHWSGRPQVVAAVVCYQPDGRAVVSVWRGFKAGPLAGVVVEHAA